MPSPKNTVSNNPTRAKMQTYLTATEWRNVDMAVEFSNFLGKDKAFFHFPYFRQTATLWYIFFQSCVAAKKCHTLRELVFSEYMMMNLFITFSTTISFITKGTLSLLLWPFFSEKNNTPFQKKLAGLTKEYAEHLPKIPFYYFPFFSKTKSLFKDFKKAENKSFTDYVSFLFAIVELPFRGAISWPIAYLYTQPAYQAPEVDKLVLDIKHNILEVDSAEAFIRDTLKNIVIRDKNGIELAHIKDEQGHSLAHIKIVSMNTQKEYIVLDEAYKKYETTTNLILEVPRYDGLLTTIKEIRKALQSSQGPDLAVLISKIEGYNAIQVNLMFPQMINKQRKPLQFMDEGKELPVASIYPNLLYSYNNHLASDQGRSCAMIDIPVYQLYPLIDIVESKAEAVRPLLRIHDY